MILISDRARWGRNDLFLTLKRAERFREWQERRGREAEVQERVRSFMRAPGQRGWKEQEQPDGSSRMVFC